MFSPNKIQRIFFFKKKIEHMKTYYDMNSWKNDEEGPGEKKRFL